jgi:SAM-dependent methyltransferase
VASRESTQRYEPAEYWENRLRQRFDLTGVGYGSLGPVYNARMYAARERALDRALQVCDRSLRGSSVLDVGCGSGFYTNYFLQREVGEYVGMDITQVSVETLRRTYPQLRFEVGDVTATRPTVSSVFDLVLAADVLFHIVDDEAFSQAIANISAWLAPGGLAVISDIFPRYPFQNAAHCRYRSMAGYQALFAQSGLRIIHTQPIFALLQPPPYGVQASPMWLAYAWIWRYGWRAVRLPPIERILSAALEWIDEAVLLRRLGQSAPNTKWLVAVNADVA